MDHRTWAFALLSFALMAAVGSVSAESPIEETGSLINDPTQIVGSETCTKCHEQELNIWRATPHFLTYSALQRKPEAKEIATKMGLRSIKRGQLCVQCHYTLQQTGSRTKAIAGVSCESCHGGAREWLAIHNDYGGPTATKQSETAAHREQRAMQSIQLGMRNPANVYLIARSCYRCHMVPHQELVNVGGHKAGSEEFEFVAWSQGTVRHNFQRTDGQSNVPSSRPRLRAMYVVGLITKLEYSLRATSAATERATYGFTSAQRAFDTRRRLAEVQERLGNDLLDQMLVAAYNVRLKTNNAEALRAAADHISELAFEFASGAEALDLSAVDSMLPAASDYK